MQMAKRTKKDRETLSKIEPSGIVILYSILFSKVSMTCATTRFKTEIFAFPPSPLSCFSFPLPLLPALYSLHFPCVVLTRGCCFLSLSLVFAV